MEKVIEVLKSYLGYLEKATNKNLDSKQKNAGQKNYTRFGRDYEKYMGVKGFINAYWCMMYQSVCFVEAYGLEVAKKLLCGNLYAYCPFAMQAFRNNGQLKNTPKKGDLVFFLNNGVASHVGYVLNVSGNTFTSIEGNTSGASGVIRNGGGVCKKTHSVSGNTKFGRPDYSLVETKTTDKTTEKLTKSKLIKQLQKAINVNVDGLYGKKTLAALPTLKNGSTGTCVKLLQKGLQELYGFEVEGGIDGIFGAGTEKAVKQFQKKNRLEVDGICGKKTWNAFLD